MRHEVRDVVFEAEILASVVGVIVIGMHTPDSFERDRIIEAAKSMVRDSDRDAFTFDAVALRAEVEPQSVSYFFDSTTQLIAEAQLANYGDIVQAHHYVMTFVEAALDNEDLDEYLAAVEQNLVLSWSAGQYANSWGVIQVLHDIWCDPFVQSHFCELLDVQFQAWITIVQRAQALGWVESDVDAKALIAVLWSSSVGQVITSGSSILKITPQEHRDFVMHMFRPPSRREAV
jgi:AcrR family transcriptional regulator